MNGTKTWMVAGLMGAALCLPAHGGELTKKPKEAAEQPAADDAKDAEEEVEVERVTGKKPPPLPSVPKEAHKDFENDKTLTMLEVADRPYPNVTYIGAEALHLDPQYVFETQRGLEMLFMRDYSGTRAHFVELDKSFPGTGVASVVDVLVWQALMLENFDFKFDKQYWVSTKAARSELDEALKSSDAPGWEHFLYVGVSGIESIHTMRQGKYLGALQLAFEAMDHLQKSREYAPNYGDLALADGMYNYWRTVVTLNSKMLPDFGDKRVEGIEQIRKVESEGVFLNAPATLSLAFTWMEEGELRRALNSCLKNRKAYPKNIVNNMMTGTTFLYMKKAELALPIFDEILVEDPNNMRVRYWRGRTFARMGELEKSAAEFNLYLGADYMESYHRSATHYRLGQVYGRLKDPSKAYAQYEAAVKVDGHKNSKKALANMKERKKEGKIDY